MTTPLGRPFRGTSSAGLDRPLPWQVSDLVVLYAGSLVGLVLVLFGWYGASGTARLSTQLAWVNAATGGAIVAGTANAVWLLAGHRAVRGRERRLLAHDDAMVPTAPVQDSGAVPSAEELVAAPAMTRYHRTTCPLAAGKPVTCATRAAHERAARRPCEACRP